MYRIMTEDKNRAAIVQLIAAYSIGASLYPCIGIWEGKEENCLTIELAGSTEVMVTSIAKTIKEMNSQDVVIIQKIETEERFI